MKKDNKKTKVHLKLKPVIILSFFVIVLIKLSLYIYNLPIKTIYINGTTYLKDKEIIEVLEIKDYPRIFKTTSNSMEKKLEKLDLVESVKVKKDLFGNLTIDIKEAKVLFYDRNLYAYVLSNGKNTNNYDFNGIPFLTNQVPDHIMKRLITELSNLKNDSLSLVSEIFYSPSMSGTIVLDDTRFLMRMNDGNEVYINLINMERLDNYHLIYTLFNDLGVLELDSDNERVVFRSYKSIKENKKE